MRQPNIMPTSPKTTGYLALAFGILAIGFSPILLVLAEAPGPVSGFYRMVTAPVLLLPWFIARLRKPGGLPGRGVRMALLAGLFFGFDMTSWTTGVMLGGATNPTLLANMAPVWVGLGAMLVFKEKLNLKFWTGLALAILGAILILGLDLKQAAEIGLGSLLGFTAAIFYGTYFLFAQRSRDRLDSLSFFWISSFTSAAVLLIVTFIFKQPLTGYPAQTYWIFLIMGVLIQLIGWFVIAYVQGVLPASIVAPSLLGQPVMAAIFAVPLLGENLTQWELLGGAAVLTGVYIVHRSRRGPSAEE